jgi:sarcosine oxidase
MGNSYDVIVVGVGAMGAAACYHLARRGVRVLGLEQFAIPHALGSSHGYSRMIRSAYYEHPDYVPLLRRAYALWEELEEQSGQKLLHATGGVYMGPTDSEVVSGSLRAAREHELPHESLDRDGLAARSPKFRLPDDFAGVTDPSAGFLLPERAIAAHAELALRQGAELHGHEAVTGWEATASGVTVHTNRATYHAGHVVFSGGAWSGRLVKDLGIELVVTRQVLGWVWPRTPSEFRLGRFPVWGIDAGGGGMYYGFPMMPDNPGLKLALHKPATPTDPDTVVRHPLPGDEETFLPALRQYLPDGEGPILAMRICLYVNSPDHHFIIDRHPAHANVTVACGFSGHGFKFASVVGEILADLAEKGRTELPIGLFGVGRFEA